MNKEQEKRVYVGCGQDYREGFLHFDSRAFEHVDHVCKAWELSSHLTGIDHIYSRHMLEHLTHLEAVRTLTDWFEALKNGGTVRIVVPDMDFHCRQWLEADWNEQTVAEKMSGARHSFAGFWGWQAESDPLASDYNPSYWDVHKSGYNSKRIIFLLRNAGFVDIQAETVNQWHLVSTACKPSGAA